MSIVYALINQKGGIGKTTASIQLAVGLKRRGYKTLVVDMDPQCNLTFTLRGDYKNGTTIMDAILKKVPTINAIQHLEEVDLLAGSSNMSLIERRLENDGKEFFLDEVLNDVRDYYDYIIIDGPPALSLITIGIMTAADRLIIPMVLDVYSLQGAGQLYKTYVAVKTYCNEKLDIEGILVTRNSQALRGVLNKVAENMHASVFKTTISNSAVVQHAAIARQSVFAYAPNSSVADEYNSFVDEILSRRELKGE